MLVRDRMSRSVITTDRHCPTQEAGSVLHRHRIHQLPVLQDDRVVGIVTDRDLRSAPTTARTVADIMTVKPTIIGPDAPIDAAAYLLRRKNIGALPVVDDGKLIGILSRSDVLDAFVDLSGVAEHTYHVTLAALDGTDVAPRVRRIIEKERGELKWLHCRKQRGQTLVHLRLKAERIDDVVTEFEAAGFEVGALVAPTTKAPPRTRNGHPPKPR